MPIDKPKEIKDLNPTTMGGARRLLADPGALDEAIESGLGKSRPDPTFDGSGKQLGGERRR